MQVRGEFCSNWGKKKCVVGSEIVHYMGGAKGMLEKLVVPPKDASCFRQACYDVTTCAGQVHHHHRDQRNQTRPTGPAKQGAFVVLHALAEAPGSRFSRNHHAMKSVLHEAKRRRMDAVVLVPSASAAVHPLTPEEENELQDHGFKVARAAWIYPPAASTTLPGRGVCNAYGYLHLHALTLVEYSAVVVLEEGMAVLGDTAPLVWCGQTDELFLAPRGVLSPLSLEVMVAAPSAALFARAVGYASTHTFGSSSKPAAGPSQRWMDTDAPVVSATTDGGVTGFAPGECAAGFVWSMLYSKQGRAEVDGDGDGSARAPRGVMLDRCSWARAEGEVLASGVCTGTPEIARSVPSA